MPVPQQQRGATPAAARLQHTCRHVVASTPAALAVPAAPAAGTTEYEAVVLAEADAEDLVGFVLMGYALAEPAVWRAAHTTWGHRTNNAQRLLVSSTMMYVAAPAPGSLLRGHASVSNVITHKDHRRRGLARELMVALLQAADGAPTSLYTTDMGRPLYESLGFRQLETVTAYAIEGACDGAVVARAATAAGVMVSVSMPTAAELDEVVPLDAAMFGGNRSRVLRATLSAPELQPTLAVARDAAGTVVAFAGSAYLGPSRVVVDSADAPQRVFGPVVAESTASALAVLAALLADHGGDSSAAGCCLPSVVKLTVRDSQPEFIAEITAWLGFVAVEDSTMPCMMANCATFPGNREMYFALHQSGSG
jgi:ribosomal protein S18 acetylase RimI-like enzyme